MQKLKKNKKLYFQNGNIYIKAEYYTGKIKREEGKHKDDSKEINNAQIYRYFKYN